MANFNRDAVKRISKAVRAEEQPPRRRHAPRADPPRIALPLRNALTTSAIGGRTTVGGVPTKGSGTADIYVDDGTDGGGETLLLAGQTIWNNYRATIPAGRWVVVGIVDGKVQVLGGDCN